MNTAQFQQQMADVINGQHSAFADTELTGPASAEQLLQVYQNNYRVSLSEYLEAVFPVCVALVGEAFFAHVAKAYIEAHPPQVPQLDVYGKMFPSFISTYEQAASVPYLADIASLEWQLDRLGNNRHHSISAFPFERLQNIDADLQTSIIFELNPNLAWQAFGHPALSIWKGVKNNVLEGINMDSPESVIFHMEADHSVSMELIDRHGIALLDALSKQHSIAQIMETPAAAQGVAVFLEPWIQAGFIINFYLSEKE